MKNVSDGATSSEQRLGVNMRGVTANIGAKFITD
jgi:hypothetical protein